VVSIVEGLECYARRLCRGLCAIQLLRGPDKHAELVRHKAGLCMSGNPVPDCLDFLILAFVGLDGRRRPIE
jgi:hypothetical protein